MPLLVWEEQPSLLAAVTALQVRFREAVVSSQVWQRPTVVTAGKVQFPEEHL